MIESIVLKDDEEVDLTAVGYDREGNPTGPKPADRVTWRSSDPSVVVVVPDRTDVTKCLAVAAGKPGVAQVFVDIRSPGEDERTVAVGSVEVLPADVAVGEIKAGRPRPRKEA